MILDLVRMSLDFLTSTDGTHFVEYLVICWLYYLVPMGLCELDDVLSRVWILLCSLIVRSEYNI